MWSRNTFWKRSACCALVQSDIYNEILRKFRDISAFFLLYKHSYEQLFKTKHVKNKYIYIYRFFSILYYNYVQVRSDSSIGTAPF